MSATAHSLNDRERLDWLQLIRSENVGPSTFWRLIEQYGKANHALDALPDLARRGGLKRDIRKFAREDAEQEFKTVKRCGGRFLAVGEADYPALIGSIHAPPPLLCIMGQSELLNKRSVSIVGARNASALGVRVANELARDLGERGAVIVSGMARGIDTAAHKGSLGTGTIAVLAGGIDSIYPPQNEDLYESIKEQGVILSEMPLGYQAQARDFPRRNRLISGIAIATIVVEASTRSGSLITARLAAEQGREVFAIPGSPQDPRHQGTNALIRDGANLVENADQVIEALNRLNWVPFDRTGDGEPALRAPQSEAPLPTADVDRAHESLIELLSPAPVEIDELIRQSGQTPAAVHAALLELELAGRLERHVGGKVSLL